MQRRWPRGLDNCISCGVERDAAVYGGRALCIQCYGYARRHNRLSQYEFVGRATGRDNIARRVANHMGSVWAAKQLGVPVETYMEWCERRGEVALTPTVEHALKKLHRVITQPTASERARLFDYEQSGELWLVLFHCIGDTDDSDTSG